jgi:hypothetical protein
MYRAAALLGLTVVGKLIQRFLNARSISRGTRRWSNRSSTSSGCRGLADALTEAIASVGFADDYDSVFARCDVIRRREHTRWLRLTT